MNAELFSDIMRQKCVRGACGCLFVTSQGWDMYIKVYSAAV